MTSAEAYKRLLLKINKNDTNSDIDISKGEFVLLFNEQKDRWLKEQIDKKSGDIDIQDLAELQEKHIPLARSKDADRYSVFTLPDNYFNYASSYAICSNAECQGVIVGCFPFKPKNENMLLEDANWQPSLEYEETVVDLSGNSIYVYRKDFNIDELYLNYYRIVGAIDIAGYRRLDGTQSTNIDPDLSDVYVDEILNRCSREIITRYENPDGYQLATERVKEED
jgi:hypothetical protein